MATAAEIAAALERARAAGNQAAVAEISAMVPDDLPAAATAPGVSAGRQFDKSVGNFGQVEPGTIDFKNLPVVHNPDGSVSTVRSMSFQDDSGLNILVPTVVRGKVVSEKDAIDEYYKTGRHLGKFNDPMAADRYAQLLHEREADRVLGRKPDQTAEAEKAGATGDHGYSVDQIQAAISRAQAAGNQSAVDELTAMLPQSDAAPAEKKRGDYGLGGITGMFAADPRRAAHDLATFVKAAAQGIPLIGSYTDEAAAAVKHAVTGQDYEKARQEYMAPVDAMPEWQRMAAGLIPSFAGGGMVAKAVPAAAKGLGLLLGAGAGAIEGAGAAEDGQRGLGAAVGGGAGLATGLMGVPVAKAGRYVVGKLGNLLSSVEDPFARRGGDAARKLLRDSAENNAQLFGDIASVDTSRPLIGQGQFAAASDASRRALGHPQATIIAAADREAAAGTADLERGMQALIPTASINLKNAGREYQRIGIANMAAKDAADQVYGSPVVRDPKLLEWMSEKPAIKKILKAQETDDRLANVSPLNATRLHALASELGDRARAVAKKSGAAAGNEVGRLRDWQGKIYDALDANVPGYADVRQRYAETVGLQKARDLGLKATPKSMPDITAMSALERREFAGGVAEQLANTIAPPGGTPLSPARAMAAIERSKPLLRDGLFAGNTVAYEQFSSSVERGMKRLEASAIARGPDKFVSGDAAVHHGAPLVSGSYVGFLMRAITAASAHVADVQARKAGRRAAGVAADVLKETDPQKIAAAMKMINTDPFTNIAAARGRVIFPGLFAEREAVK